VIAGGPTWLSDGFWNQLGGMDGSKSPDLIGPAFYALGVNVAARGGKPTTRPGIRPVLFDPVDDSGDYLRNYPCNGAFGYYDTEDARTEVIFVCGGKLLRSIPAIRSLEDITPAGGDFDFYLPCYFVQAERFLIIQNGQDIPWIYDGLTARRSRTGSNNPNKTISALTQTGGLATLTTASPHGFVSGDYIQIEGVTPDGYNGDYYILVTGATTFTFICTSTLTSPASAPGVVRFAPEVPVGTIMAFGQGRLFVTPPDRTTFEAGDIIFGDLLGTDKNLLRFTENQYLAEGGDFSLPATMGRITGMDFIPQQDTTTGQGELMVRGEYGVASFAVSAPRSTWKNTQIQRITFTDIGGVSPNGSAFVNNDVFFRTPHGIQSYRQARADLNSYGQTLVSSEVSRILDNDNKRLLGGVSAASFNNRVLFTCSPVQLPRSVQIVSLTRVGLVLTVTTLVPYEMDSTARVIISGSETFDGEYVVASTPSPTTFTVALLESAGADEVGGSALASFPEAPSFIVYRGAVSLDFHALAMVGQRSAAAYDGLWTGMNIRTLFGGRNDGVPTLYFVRCDSFLGATLWESSTYLSPDEDRGLPVRQQCLLETRGFDFQKPFTLKKLARADLWVSELRGKVDFKIYYRADNYPCWVEWDEFSFCSLVDEPEINETDPLSPITPRALQQSRTQRRLAAPSDECDPTTKKLLRLGYNFQFRLEWAGVCRIEKFLAHALETAEQMGGDC
jgi:hypothetical protein